MRIDSSDLSMASTGSYIEKDTKDESLKTWTGDKRPDFEGGNSGSRFAAIRIEIPQDILDLSEEGKKALAQQAKLSVTGSAEDEESIFYELSDADKQKLLMIQKMIEALTGKKIQFVVMDRIKLKKLQSDPSFFNTFQLKNPVRIERPVIQRQGWGLEFDSHQSHYEKQDMSFSAAGTVKTSDGREINVDLQLSMSREFMSRQDVSIRAGDALLKDPLVINFNSPAAGLSGQNISFDIDVDGTSEQMSFLRQGSGFLALDKNGDGVVNDGSELFGPASGDGFADLSAYDGDKNGWIDENDEIYDKLRIWTKDEEGNDKLFALGQKGIGAIYLGNVASSFDLKDVSGQKLGDIGSTGVFLREDGSAGTIQHIDLAV